MECPLVIILLFKMPGQFFQSIMHFLTTLEKSNVVVFMNKKLDAIQILKHISALAPVPEENSRLLISDEQGAEVLWGSGYLQRGFKVQTIVGQFFLLNRRLSPSFDNLNYLFTVIQVQMFNTGNFLMCYQKSQRHLVKQSEKSYYWYHYSDAPLHFKVITIVPIDVPIISKVLKVIKLFMEYSAFSEMAIIRWLPGPLTPLGVE